MDELKGALLIFFADHACFKEPELSGHTETRPWPSNPEIPRLQCFPGHHSKIYFPKRCLHDAEAAASARSFDDPNAPSICMILRQRFSVAVALCHEVCHALRKALEEHPFRPEPYYNDHSHAEVGKAFEASTFGGSLQAIKISSFSKWGMCTMKWPGGYDLRAPSRYASRRRWMTIYIVPMDYIAKVQTRWLWEYEVRTFGMAALRVPKVYGLRYGKVTQHERDFAGSSTGSSCDCSADHQGRVIRAVD